MQAERFIFTNLFFGCVYSICAPGALTFVGFLRRPRRNEVMQVEISSKKCVGQYIQYYSWKVIDYDTGNIVQTSYEPFIFISGYDFPINRIFEKTYGLSIEASHYPQMIFSSQLEHRFEFQPVPMNIVLMGGSVRTHPAGQNLIIDAWTLSADNSYSLREKVIGDEFEWKVSPDVPVLDNNTLKLVISSEHINVGDILLFGIKVKRKRFKRLYDEKLAFQSIKVIAPNSPMINLVCVKNCKSPHYQHTTVFSVLCTSNCRNINYTWRAEPELDIFNSQFGNGHDKLVIEPMTVEPGSILNVEVTAKGSQAKAFMSLKFMQKLVVGKCIFAPKRGWSGYTAFFFNCSGYKSEYGKLTYVLYLRTDENNDGTHILHQTNPVFITFLPAGNKFHMRVMDKQFMSVSVNLTLRVRSYFQRFTKNLTTVHVKKFVLGESESILSATASHARFQAFHRIMVSTEAVTSDSLTEDEKEDLRKHLVDSVFSLKPNNYLRADQTFTVLKLLYISTPKNDSYMKKRAADIIRQIAGTLYFSINVLRERVPLQFMRAFARDLINFGSYLLESVDELRYDLEFESGIDDYVSYDDLLAHKMEIRDNMRQTFENVLASLQAMGIVLLLNAVPNEKPFLLATKTIFVSFRRISKSELLREDFSFPTFSPNSIVLSRNFSINVMKTKFTFIDFQFCHIKRSIIWWQKNYSLYNTDFVLLDFFNGKFKFETVHGNFTIHLKAKQLHIGTIVGYLPAGNDQIEVFKVPMKESATLAVKFVSDKNYPYKVAISDHYCTRQFMKRNSKIIEPAADTENMYSDTKNEKRILYICIQKLIGTTLDFQANLSSIACTYYDQASGVWTYAGCTAVKADLGVHNSLDCVCNHLSVFGGVTIVPSAKRNENYDFDITISLSENWLPVFVILFMLTSFAVLLLIAAKRDRDFQEKDVICKLDDDVPGDSFIYVVVVFTGSYFDAGTTADVGFQIIGEKSSSRNHLIKCCCVRMLKRRSQDWFLIHTPEDLGALKKIRLWHNCKGSRPHWYCKKVIIQDLKSGDQYFFFIEKWFSLVWGNSRVYREIPVCTTIQLRNTTFLLKNQLTWHYHDKHLWFSILMRDAQSNFSSKERVGAAFSSLFLSMMVSALLYGIPSKIPSDSISSKTRYYLSEREVVTYFASVIITLPFSLFIVLLFRETKNTKESEEFEESLKSSKGNSFDLSIIE